MPAEPVRPVAAPGTGAATGVAIDAAATVVPAATLPGKRAEQVASIAAALVVAAGVLWFDWPAFLVLALYWIENVVIGVANVIKLLAAGLGGAAPVARAQAAKPAAATSRVGSVVATLFMVPFFCVHYGMFCLVHGTFVVALFSGDKGAKDVFFDAPFYLLDRVLGESWGWIALAAIVATVVVDTGRWFAARRAGAQRTLQQVMTAPYGRIVVLHLVLIGGGFLLALTNAPQTAVLLLTAFKLIYDLRRARQPAM
jgi:hypothetical protein